MVEDKKIGLALSGGGYRAAAFHLGTFRKLQELGILEKVDVLSTISGGSIAGAYYVLNKTNFKAFEAGLEKALQKSVIRRIIFSRPIMLLALSILALLIFIGIYTYSAHGISWLLSALIVIVILLLMFQFTFLPFTKLKIKAYRKLFFDDRQLKDLPDVPKMAINATNLETGTLWTYSKDKISDSSYAFPKDGGKPILFNGANFPVAMAVASSTCVPVPFPPVKIPKEYFMDPKDFDRVSPSLSDGGLYDNQGIHKLTEPKSSYSCDIIICSDGSQPFQFSFKGKNSIGVLYRANDVEMRKIKSLQFIRDVYSKKYEIAYFSLDWQYELCVSSFVTAIRDGKIKEALIKHHVLTPLYLANVDQYKNELIGEVKKSIGFDTIIATGLTSQQIKDAGLIATGLSAFKKERIDILSKHAETLTEIQIRLYCPSLLK